MHPAPTAPSALRDMLATLIGVVGLAAATASAQNALGDGRALDASPRVGSGGYNDSRPTFAEELQFRNAIVTGNAPGGLSFRGDLGYRAAGEFTGELGSDSLFAFRRDSLYSGLAGMGIRGTEALQYQFGLTTGATPPQNLVGDLFVGRGSGSYVATPLGAPPIYPDPDSPDPRGLNLYQPSIQEADLADALLGSLRSSSTYTSTNTLSPVLLSTFEQGIERRPYGLTSSILTGVTATPMQSDEEGPAQRPTGRPRDPGAEARTAYNQVIDTLRARAEARAELTDNPEAGEASTVNEQLARLRAGLLGLDDPTQTQTPADPNAPTVPADPNAPQDPGVPADPNASSPVSQSGTVQSTEVELPGVVTPGVETPGVDPSGVDIPGVVIPGDADPDAPTQPGPPDGVMQDGVMQAYDPALMQVDQATLDLIRASEQPIQTLTDPDAANRDVFSEHMRAGERLIADEQYFDAEERFARALALRPGDQTAQIGRVHAQIGAGLLNSASVNLRSLLIMQPEMIGVRYAGRLLPAPDRIDLLIENLRERSGAGTEPARQAEEIGVRRSAAFLMAYLGFQNHQPAVIAEGLETLRAIGADDDRRLAAVLTQVWLPESSPAEGDE